MTDWQLERAAGEAAGLKLDGVEGRDAFLWNAVTGAPWWPLSSPHQAMELVLRFHLHIDQRPGKQISVQDPHFKHLVEQRAPDLDLLRAIVECVAKMHAKPSP